MQASPSPITIGLLIIAASTSLPAAEDAPALSPDLGGRTTTTDKTMRAFGQPVKNLPFEQRGPFEVGDSLFNQNWVTAPASTTARDGLGPLFNARSCSACHSRDGRGQALNKNGSLSDSILFRLSIPGQDAHGGPVADPNYGGQFNHRSIQGVDAEGSAAVTYTELHGNYADGTPYVLVKPHYSFTELKYGPLHKHIMVSPRVAPQMIGLGLLESVAEADILAKADPEDKDGDGISGRANYVWDKASQSQQLGRFGWKANQPNLRQQVAGAFVGDIGISSNVFPDENHTKKQGESGLNSIPHGGKPELTDQALDRVTFYSQHLAVPRQRDAESETVKKGWLLFNEAGCASCHRPTMTTGATAVSEALAKQTFHPFTDLLLHDMGPELADNRPDFKADGREWRTPPLWGIGLFEKVNGHTRYLHDGRARNLSEAILWHGGESEKSRDSFKNMNAEQRSHLLAFLQSL